VSAEVAASAQSSTSSPAAEDRAAFADELRTTFLFEALRPDQLDFLTSNGAMVTFKAGEPIFVEGEPATCFFVLLDGEVRLTRTVRGGGVVELNRTTHRGAYAGATQAYIHNAPKTYGAGMDAVTDVRVFSIPASDFATAIRTWFPMAMHMLEGLFFGMRASETMVSQRERINALGTLTAGLTHELNNPAAAASRATAALRDRFAGMRHKLAMLADGRLDGGVLQSLTVLQEEFVSRIGSARDLTALERSDREEALGEWLEGRAVAQPWELAGVFVAAGLGDDDLERVAAAVAPSFLEPALRWLAYTVETETLLVEIAESTGRISTLVDAAKQYSQMDRTPHQPTDVHVGLDATLVMLSHKIAPGVTVVKEYDRSLPEVPAYAGELNQVWTNLIVNALDAMDGEGTLTLRTSRDGDCALVEIADTGPGIPEELRRRVFEPFFTTKPVGQGTGLGLDVSWRIVVKRHGGDLRVTSKPGDTRFQVLLPLTESAAPAA
jgi:signal transduction histidine kinase